MSDHGESSTATEGDSTKSARPVNKGGQELFQVNERPGGSENASLHSATNVDVTAETVPPPAISGASLDTIGKQISDVRDREEQATEVTEGGNLVDNNGNNSERQKSVDIASFGREFSKPSDATATASVATAPSSPALAVVPAPAPVPSQMQAQMNAQANTVHVGAAPVPIVDAAPAPEQSRAPAPPAASSSAATEAQALVPVHASAPASDPALDEKPKVKYYYKPKIKPKPKKIVLPPTPMHYYDPSPSEKNATFSLIGAKVCIFWDGEGQFYEAVIKGFNPATGLFQATYVDDVEPPPLYDEDLTTSIWRIWKGPAKSAAPIVAPPIESSRGSLGRACKVEDYSDMFNDGPKEKKPLSAGPHKRSKMSYEDMVAEAVFQIADYRYGASLNSVRRYVEQTFSVGKMHVASFNKKTIDGVNTAIARLRIERTSEKSHTYRPTLEEKNRKRIEAEEQRRRAQEEMNRARQAGLNKSSSSSSSGDRGRTKDDYELNIIGTAVENNRGLRTALIEQRGRRDRHLEAIMPVLKPFLPEKNYFQRKDAREQKHALSQRQQQLASSSISDSTSEEKLEGKGENAEAEVPAADESSELLNSALKDVKMLPVPEQLTATMHDHQTQGISWMVHMYQRGMPMILGDQMGLGKTLQSIGFFAYLKYSLNVPGPFLVVVPLSVLSNWITEINRFCPTLRAVRFHGPKEERARIKSEELGDLQDFDVVVTTYEVVVSEANWLKRKYMWTSIVVDEGHRLKNEKSQLSEKLRAMPCLSKVILSGTPLQNNLRELWALLHFLAPDVFNNATAQVFTEGFDVVKNVIDNRTLRLSRKLLGVFMLRRLKEHVAITLPSRRELTVLVPLTEQQKLLYKHLLCGLDKGTMDMVMGDGAEREEEQERTEAKAGLKKASSSTSLATSSSAGGGGGTSMNDTDWRKLMNLLLQLRKICNHTYLMPEMAPHPYEVTEDIVQGSGKLQMLDRLLPKLKADEHRVLIFSQFTSMLDLLEDFCELREHAYARLDGETNRVQRRLDCRRFNAANSPLFIFLISTRAGGLGLNLATADTVILYDSDWNPQVDLQAMERAHRIGQVNPVRVFRLVCSGSIEERMISRAEKKLYLNAMVAEQSEEQVDELGDLTNAESAAEAEDVSQALGIGTSSMSKGELASLIRFGANAVVDSEVGASSLSEEQLDRLLERQGRDLPYPGDAVLSSSSSSLSSSSSSSEKKSDAASSELESVMQEVLRTRMEKLKEIDLRQLGDTYYASARDRKMNSKGKGKVSETNAESVVWVDDNEDDLGTLVMGGKRNRKQRITMVSSAGSGYGGAIPTLSSEWGKDEEAPPASSASLTNRRSRDWNHQTFCCLCARSYVRAGDNMLKCVHCPKIFHESCLAAYEWPRNSMGFICPHHRCQSCSRGTAAAGGLLFRCVDCLTSYCEDCLPDEEVESIGRCRALEELGYHARQAYYIKCSPCCVDSGIEATGVHGDALDGDEEKEKNGKGNGAMDVEVKDNESPEPPLPLPSAAVTGIGEEGADETSEAAAAAAGGGGGGGGAGTTDMKEEEDKRADAEQEEEDAESEEEFLLTQYMKVKWESEPDSEEEREKARIEDKRIKAEKRAAATAERKKKRARSVKGLAKGKSRGNNIRGKKERKRRGNDFEDEEDEDENKEESDNDDEEECEGVDKKRRRKGASPKSRARGRRGARSTKRDDGSDGDNEDEDEEEEEEEEEDEMSEEKDQDEEEEDEYWSSLGIKPEEEVSFDRALDILVGHSSWQSLQDSPDFNVNSLAILASVKDKAVSGRYRGARAFLSDVQHLLGEMTAKKRGEAADLKSDLSAFFATFLGDRVSP